MKTHFLDEYNTGSVTRSNSPFHNTLFSYWNCRTHSLRANTVYHYIKENAWGWQTVDYWCSPPSDHNQGKPVRCNLRLVGIRLRPWNQLSDEICALRHSDPSREWTRATKCPPAGSQRHHCVAIKRNPRSKLNQIRWGIDNITVFCVDTQSTVLLPPRSLAGYYRGIEEAQTVACWHEKAVYIYRSIPVHVQGTGRWRAPIKRNKTHHQTDVRYVTFHSSLYKYPMMSKYQTAVLSELWRGNVS